MTAKREALKEAYFHWLVAQVGGPRYTPLTYWDLLRLMHDKEFIWIVSNDDNRMHDGTDLRVEFLDQKRARDVMIREDFGPCSLLEVMIGISRRLAFAVGKEPEYWALQLIKNLGLRTAADPLTGRRSRQIENRLDNLIWRNYNPDGSGGFFPLKYPPDDQTKDEIWYQMGSYIAEMQNLRGG